MNEEIFNECGRPKAGYYKQKLIRFTEKQWQQLIERRDKTTIPIAVQVRLAVDEYLKNLEVR